MKRRFLLCVLAVIGLALTISVDSAEAGRFRQRHGSRPYYRPAARAHIQKPSSVGIRQVDGKTLWDLGKQMGRWPSLP